MAFKLDEVITSCCLLLQSGLDGWLFLICWDVHIYLWVVGKVMKLPDSKLTESVIYGLWALVPYAGTYKQNVSNKS